MNGSRFKESEKSAFTNTQQGISFFNRKEIFLLDYFYLNIGSGKYFLPVGFFNSPADFVFLFSLFGGAGSATMSTKAGNGCLCGKFLSAKLAYLLNLDCAAHVKYCLFMSLTAVNCQLLPSFCRNSCWATKERT